MKRVQTFVAAAVLATCCHVQTARATLLTNGDFSSGSQGWETTGSAVVTDFSGVSSSYGGRWDLTSWQSTMNGNFMLFESGGGLYNHIKLTGPSTLQSLTFSMSYAVAWDTAKLVGNDYAYFYPSFSGRNVADGRYYPVDPLGNPVEIDWGLAMGKNKGTQTGVISLAGFHPLKDGVYDELTLSLLMINPNQSFFQIAGFDDFQFSAMDDPTQPDPPGGSGDKPSSVPAPEPSTVLLLGLALAGTAIAAGKTKRTVPGV